jgi:hypothetical protein
MLTLLAQAGQPAGVDLLNQYFIAGGHQIGGVNSIYALVSLILPNAYVIAGLILFIYTLAGGFLIMTGASDPHKADSGKQIITNAIIGFAILFASYWLIQIIEIVTGVNFLNPTIGF